MMKILKTIIGLCYTFSVFINTLVLWHFAVSPTQNLVNPVSVNAQRALVQVQQVLPAESAIPTPATPKPTITIQPPLISPTSSIYYHDYDELNIEIQGILSTSAGTWGVIINDLTNEKKIMINKNEVFHGASTTKLLTAVTILTMIEDGKVDLIYKIDGQTIKDLMSKMVNRSDNDAWDSLNKIATTKEREKIGVILGMTTLDVSENRLSPLDMSKLLKSIYFDEILTAENKAFLYGLMQNTQEETRIPDPIPLDIPIVHKSGNYNDVFHDVGIIMYKRPYMVIIMGKGTNVEEGRRIVQDISKVVFDYYQSN